MANSSVILQAKGLQTSNNELTSEDGALIEAKNVIIKRNNLIEQRRGFKLWGNALDLNSETVKQLTTYRNRIIRHYSNKLQFDSTGLGTFETFSGSFLEAQTGLRMKFIESNGNFYFTTEEGIKKISAPNADALSTDAGYVTSAGAVKAIDLTGEIIYIPESQSDFLVQDGAVAYRAVWGYKDANNNLVLGAPSQRVIVSNPMIDLLMRDYMTFLDILDNLSNTPLTTARIADGNYVDTLKLNFTNNAIDLYTNLIALTAKLDNDIFIASDLIAQPLQIGTAAVASNLLTINIITGDARNYLQPGSKIMLGGGWDRGGVSLAGARVVSSVTASTIVINVTAADGAVTLSSPTIHSNEYRSITQPSATVIPTPNSQLVEMQDYIMAISDRLLDEPDAIVSAADKTVINGFDVTTTVGVRLTVTIPEGINDNYFVQLYRSPVARATGAGAFDDVVPNDELQLVYEAYPTAAELAISEMIIDDITPDEFRGANLYTNASTGEGILQANDIPPFAKDINRYRNSVFYANTRTVHRMNLNLLGVVQMLADYNLGTTPKVTIANSEGSNTYSFIQGEQHVDTIETVADVANSLNGKYFLLDSRDNKYYVWLSTGTGVDPAISGRVGIKVNIITNETANNVALKIRNKLSLYLDDFIVTGATNQVIVRCFEVGVVDNATDGDTGFTFTNNFAGKGERVQPQITSITAVTGAEFATVGVADNFTLFTTSDNKLYRFWFNTGTVTNPAIAGEFAVEIVIVGTETASDVANLIAAAMPTEFTASALGAVVTVTNNVYGYAGTPTENVVDSDFLISVTQVGALDVILSPLVSPARAVDETAKSFIRVINKNPGEVIYGHYISSVFDIPGKMLLEARTLSEVNPFYIVGNNDNTGLSFNPDIGPEGTFTNTLANPTVITTSFTHGLLTGDTVLLTNSNSVPLIDGLHTITYISPTSFSIDKNVTVAGNTGSYIKPTNSVFSENESKINRVYYSKFLQPDAVPISNFFDVGASDKEILRIVPLRDSLFVFKEDGLYRISGESAPFQLELFDNSFITLAPDSVAVANNIIYAWTTQGIQSLSEGGSAIISRPIDDIILKIQSANYTDFKTATWGVGYESDNAYLVFTVDQMEDEVATICYRYSTLTNTWTTYDISKTCGTINQLDDKLYLGCSDVPFIEQERKTFSRLDYADRELSNVISSNRIISNTIILPDITGISVGDVVVQDQTITTTEFNILLEKLDLDSGVNDSDYLSTLTMITGDSPSNKILALAAKLDLDSGVDSTNYESTIATKFGTISATSAAFPTVITTSAPHGLLTGRIVRIDSTVDSSPDITGNYEVTVLSANTFSIPARVRVAGTVGNYATVDDDFRDIKTCYNTIVDKLNVDNGVSFTNYKRNNNNTIQESIITEINKITRKITVNLELEYLVGNITIFKSIPSSFTYAPVTMGDPLMLKRMAEASIMFESRALTGGALSFATDLLPEFIQIPFKLDGNGIFGHSNFGSGFFGGVGNAAPFRTFIPRQCQWCRYIVVKFEHNTARENYHISGMTLTGNIGLSTRGYK